MTIFDDVENENTSYSSELLRPQWIDDFEQSMGRPLRVLHYGNIANNAYMNAKIMRTINIHADVVSADYYHAMATPEWEDAKYSGKIGDLFFPDWWRIKTDFKRPRWFFQGPRKLVQGAIRAQFENRPGDEHLYEEMTLASQYICYRDSALNDKSNESSYVSFLRRRLDFIIYLIKFFGEKPARLIPSLLEFAPWIKSVGAFFRLLLYVPVFIFLFIGSLFERIGNWFAKSGVFFGTRLTLAAMRMKWRIERQIFERLLKPSIPLGSVIFKTVTGKKFSTVFGETATEYFLGRAEYQYFQPGEYILEDEVATDAFLNEKERAIYLDEMRNYLRNINNKMRWVNGHRSWHKSVDSGYLDKDIILADGMTDGWDKAFRHYDIIQCYSTDGIIPMALGKSNYLCYEHGTLRSIPFEQNSIGRLTASAYRSARNMIVTNLDTIDRLKQLKIPQKKAIFLPAPLDDSRYHKFTSRYAHNRPSPDAPVRFFSASRQHWLDKDPNYAKGNDIFLRAFANVVNKKTIASITLVEWGRDVESTKTLIKDLGIEDRVHWVPQMKIEELWHEYISCHAVVDQFIIPAFGRVTFDALMLGVPVISNLDKLKAKRFFGESPPMLVSSDAASTERAIKNILSNPNSTKEIGDASRKWAVKYHSSQRVIDLQLEAYRSIVDDAANLDDMH